MTFERIDVRDWLDMRHGVPERKYEQLGKKHVVLASEAQRIVIGDLNRFSVAYTLISDPNYRRPGTMAVITNPERLEELTTKHIGIPGTPEIGYQEDWRQ
jgi:hypothetical protein